MNPSITKLLGKFLAVSFMVFAFAFLIKMITMIPLILKEFGNPNAPWFVVLAFFFWIAVIIFAFIMLCVFGPPTISYLFRIIKWSLHCFKQNIEPFPTWYSDELD